MHPANFLKLQTHSGTCKRTLATLISGKFIAEKILSEVRTAVESFKIRHNHVPTLTAVLVGDNAASKLYLKNKVAAANSVGINADVLRLHTEISENLLVEKLTELNNNDDVDAILLQLPLPDHINKRVFNLISVEKDVDGFTSANFGKFCFGFDTFIPCTALAVREIIQHINIDISGKNAVVCGRSKHVGLPIAMLLHSSIRSFGFNANTVICHRFTPHDELSAYCQNADIVISATGVPSLIRGYMIKKGAIVIDVGITRTVDPVSSKIKLSGDVNFEEVSKVASFLTPVPGGVGPLTVAMLLKNTFLAAQHRKVEKQ